jgi:hypothetical protein
VTVVLDAHEREHLDPRRHAAKPLGLRLEHDPLKIGAVDLDKYVHTHRSDGSEIVVPTSVARTAAANAYPYGILHNDTYGCCVAAAGSHMQESLRLKFSISPVPWTPATTLHNYFVANGYTQCAANPELSECAAGGPCDQGTDPSVWMNDWQAGTIMHGHDLEGWGWLGQGSPNLRRIVAEFGCAMLCVALATQQQSQGTDWVYEAGEQCGSWGGHAIDCDCYDENGFGFITWGEEGTCDNAFNSHCGEGLWVPLTTAALGPGGVGPMGTDFAQLKSDLAALSQGQPEQA